MTQDVEARLVVPDYTVSGRQGDSPRPELGLGLRRNQLVNLGLVAPWLWLALRIGREFRRKTRGAASA